MLENFNSQDVINFISIYIDDFLIVDNDELQNAFLQNLNQIYNNYSNLVLYLNQSQINKIIQISNIYENYNEVINVIDTIMTEYDQQYDKRLLYIMQILDINNYMMIIESDNYCIINSIFNIFCIYIKNLPSHISILIKDLLEKIESNYINFPLKTKSYAINCIAYLFCPDITLPMSCFIKFDFIQIIFDHLQMNLLEDEVNSLFILQSLIILSINSKYENILRELLYQEEFIDILENIENDEICKGFGNDSIESIKLFITCEK